MKFTLRRFWLLLPLLLVLSACGGPIESMTFTSPEGDRSIDVKGKRESPAGPIIVTVDLHVPAGNKSFTFEHQASSMTKETVTATWANNMECVISFKMDDGTSWEVEAYLLDDKVQAIKKFSLDGKSVFE